MGDKIDKISEAMSDREYRKKSAELDAQGNTGVLEDVGSKVEKAGNTIDATGEKVQKVGKGIENTGKAVETAGKGMETAGKGMETAGKGMKSAGKGMQATGKSMQAAGQGMQAGGQAAKAAGSGVSSAGAAATDAGAALSSTGVGAIAGIPLAALGITGQAAGAGAQAAGTASDVAGKGVEGAGKGVESAGKGVEKAGEGVEKAGTNVKNAGGKVKDAGKKVQDKGKSVQDTGKQISDSGKKLRDKGVNIRSAANSEDMGQGALNEAEKAGKKAAKAILKDVKDQGKVLKDVISGKPSLGGIAAGGRVIIRRIIIALLLLLVIFAFIYDNTLGPIIEGMNLDEVANNVADYHEKGDNYLNGLGFQDSEQAFYEELKFLNSKYENQLDIPLIMATLFFDDIMQNGEGYEMGLEDASEDDGASGSVALAEAFNWISEKVKESNVTVGQDGLEYSSNKIYRLRKLAKHSFATGMFGLEAKKKGEETIPLSDYIAKCKEQIGGELYQILEALPALFLLNPVTAAMNAIESIYQVLSGSEVFSTTDSGAILEDNALTHLYSLLKQIFWSTWMDVKSVGLCADGGICVTYSTYERSEEAYENYLRKYYFKYMPEFKNYIDTSSEDAYNKSVDEIIKQIKELKEEYETIFGVTEQNAEFYSNICKGNVKKSLLTELIKPVDIAADKELCFSGTYGYGTSGSLNHRGVDINTNTTGNKEGDPVYSIYSNGKVTKSSKDKKFKCDDCKGGWLEIEYDAQLSDGAYKFKVVYGGLDPNSISLTKNKTVQKGQAIGKIGSKNDSEVDVPSLHFGIYDMNTNQYLDPTNLFISCGTVGSLRGEGNEDQIWNYLIDYGYSEAGAAGVMGNWQAESGFLPNNVENCVTVYSDDTFPSLVASGAISKDKFKATVGNGCERTYPGNSTYAAGGFGFGIGQWTEFSRKDNFYEFWKKSGANLDDLQMQLEWYIHEADSISGLHDYLKTATDPYQAAGKFSNLYEGPLIYGDRAKYAQELYNKHKGTTQKSSSTPSSSSGNKASPSCYSGGGGGAGVNVSGQTAASGKSREEKLKMVFPNGIPTSNAEVEQYLTTVECDTLNGKIGVQVHKVIAQDVIAACAAAKSEGFNIYSIGGYRSYSSEAQDSAGTIPSIGLVSSQHGYGLAVDINPTDNGQFINGRATGNWSYNPSDSSKKNVTITESSAVYKSFISNGWGWGGSWNSSKDYMHFSFFGT